MVFPCVVHLDLKGAPWRLDYLFKVLSFIREHGACGVLIEWEDTFPYTSELINIGSLGGCSRDGMYSNEEVNRILEFCNQCGLEVIQLLQSIGHLEFLLKHSQYQYLREVSHSPAVLCPSKADSLSVVKAMARQMMGVQPNARYLHIGGDEAWHMNVCTDCRQRSSTNRHGVASLFLEHISNLATFIKERYPQVTVLIWDDMIRNIQDDVLKAYNMGNLVEPVIWNYNMKEHFQIDQTMWERYSRVFPKMWAASAFKGANGSCQMLCSAKRYASNQLAWREEMDRLKGRVAFAGIILTGWSRFDHYATLCELLPVALPSLASCLKMWMRHDGFTNDNIVQEYLPADIWPGSDIASAVQNSLQCRARCLAFLDGDQIQTWLNPWQIENRYTSPLQAENIAITAKQLSAELESLWRSVSAVLHSATGRRSAEEVLHSWLAPTQRRLAEVAACATTAHTRVSVTPNKDL